MSRQGSTPTVAPSIMKLRNPIRDGDNPDIALVITKIIRHRHRQGTGMAWVFDRVSLLVCSYGGPAGLYTSFQWRLEDMHHHVWRCLFVLVLATHPW